MHQSAAWSATVQCTSIQNQSFIGKFYLLLAHHENDRLHVEVIQKKHFNALAYRKTDRWIIRKLLPPPFYGETAVRKRQIEAEIMPDNGRLRMLTVHKRYLY